MTPLYPTPEQELASAYLDGDVTAVERAHVEATPELRALVASMSDVRSFVAAVPVVSAAVRDAAITSAIAQFDGVATNLAVSLPVSLASRRRWPNKVMSAAAAAVVLGVVGITVLSNTRDDKSETSSRESEPKFETNTAEDAAGAVPADTAGDEVSISMAPPIVIDDPQQLLALPVPLPPTAEAPPDADTQRVESFNVEALACMDDDQVFLADILYQGALAIAVRDTVTGVTEAIDSTCTVLASVSP